VRKKRENDYDNGISEIGKQISAIPLTKMWEKKRERIGEKIFPIWITAIALPKM